MIDIGKLFRDRMVFVSVMVLLFPLFVNTIRHWVSSIYVLIFILSISAIKQYRWDLKKEEKILLVIFALHVITVSISNALAGWTYASNTWFFSGELRLLAAIPIYLYLRRIPEIWKLLLTGIPIAATIIGLTGISDFLIRYYSGDVAMIFAEGVYGHIFMGNIAALLSITSYLCIDYFKENKYFSKLCGIGAMLAFVAALLSITRNAWLSLIVLYFIAFIISGRARLIISRIRLRQYIIAIAVITPTLYFLSSIDYVKARFERIVEEPVAYFNADRSEILPYTSIGFRFEQWRGVLLAFQEKPLFGHGVGNMANISNRLVREGKLNRMVYLEHNEREGEPTLVHSAYFEYLGDTGIVGFIVTLLMIFYPTYVSIRRRAKSILAWKFVLLNSIAFSVASLTEVPFIRNNWTSVFVVFGVVGFIWLMQEDSKDSRHRNEVNNIGASV